MTEGTGAAVAGATAGAHNAGVKIGQLEEALAAARAEYEEGAPERVVAAAEAGLAKAELRVEQAKQAVKQAKEDAAALRASRAAAAKAEKENE